MTLDLPKYYKTIENLLKPDGLFTQLEIVKTLITDTKKSGGSLLLFGNGGSAASVSHLAIDFSKQAKIPALAFNDSAAITALSNDYGYEMWIEKILDYHSSQRYSYVLKCQWRVQNLLKGSGVCENARTQGYLIHRNEAKQLSLQIE